MIINYKAFLSVGYALGRLGFVIGISRGRPDAI